MPTRVGQPPGRLLHLLQFARSARENPGADRAKKAAGARDVRPDLGHVETCSGYSKPTAQLTAQTRSSAPSLTARRSPVRRPSIGRTPSLFSEGPLGCAGPKE